MSELPPTRWDAVAAGLSDYGPRFAAMVAEGADLEGEARLADALVGRGARVLDVGSGMGRVAEALRRRGHDVTAVEKAPDLITQSRRTYPDLVVVDLDLLALTPAGLASAGRPAAYDLLVVVGNVMILLAPDTEVRALRVLRSLLAPGGRVLVGFRESDGPEGSREYSREDFRADLAEAGLEVELVRESYELRTEAGEPYGVWILSAGA